MKAIRIWHGCKVVGLLTVDEGSSSFQVAGGAQNSTEADIEIDPWAGLIVAKDAAGNRLTPRYYAEEEQP